MKFKVILGPDVEDGGFNVSCPALPGCHSQGDTMDEALMNIKEAIEGCLEVLNDKDAVIWYWIGDHNRYKQLLKSL